MSEQAVAEMLALGKVPTHRVAPILRRTLLEQFGDIAGAGAVDFARVLYKWENEVECVDFDSVDRIFAHFWLTPEVWTDELSDLYYEITFNEKLITWVKRCQRKGCSNEITPPRPNDAHRQRFCSQQCQRAEWWAKGRRKRVDGPGRKLERMVCGAGLHDMHGDNLRVAANGRRYCYACKAERQRRNRAAKRAQQP